MSIASLPMYDLPELRQATDEWWRGLARAFAQEGINDVPAGLLRGQNYHDAWSHPDLLFSQTCGYPLTHELRGKIKLVATPCYAAPGCSGPNYCSAVLVHADSPARYLEDLRGKRCVISSRSSHSGYNALRDSVAPIAGGKVFFGRVEPSGSHLNSIAMIRANDADIAAVDCVTHALLARHCRQSLSGTRVLCHTRSAPGLPYVTSLSASTGLVQQMRRSLAAACADPRLAACREALLLTDAASLSIDDYAEIDRMEKDAVSLGYETIR